MSDPPAGDLPVGGVPTGRRTSTMGPVRSSIGLDPRVLAALAYLIGWVSGLIVLLVERRSRYVRFHAFQSVIALGGLWAFGSLLWVVGLLSVFVSTAAFRVLIWTAGCVWIVGIAVWLICLVKAARGEWWRLPLAGDLAAALEDRGSRR